MANKKVFIIAEAGVNHSGSVDLAMKLIDVASDAGADAVKFQTFDPDQLVSRNSPKAEYQRRTTNAAESHLEMIRKLALNWGAHEPLIRYCKERNIKFLSSAFDLGSIDLLIELGVDIFKIPSGEITNLPYLRKLGSMRKKVIMSTGMSDIKEVRSALEVLVSSGTDKNEIIVLHCNTEYPTPLEDVNLRAMLTMRDELGVRIGYSDHTLGIEISVAAVAMGASVIEKHFTIDRNMAGPDHKASLEPSELKSMVRAIRNVESAFGTGVKEPSRSELKNINVARKSIVATIEIKKGERLTNNNISVKRPGFGISPMRWDEVLGSVANKDYKKDEMIEL